MLTVTAHSDGEEDFGQGKSLRLDLAHEGAQS
jgi:hypothetical protein